MNASSHKSHRARSSSRSWSLLLLFAGAAFLAPMGAHGDADQQFAAKKRAKTAGIAQQQAAARKAHEDAAGLAKDLPRLSKGAQDKLQQLRKIEAALAKLKLESQSATKPKPKPQNEPQPTISPRDLEQAEAVAQKAGADAKQAAADADRLNEELKTLLASHDEKQKQLKQELDRIMKAAADASQLRVAAADLEEAVARELKALETAQTTLVAQRKTLKELLDKIGASGEAVDLTRPKVATGSTRPDTVIIFVCRNQKIAVLDSMDDRVFEEWKKLADGGDKVGRLVNVVNGLNLETLAFTLKLERVHNGKIIYPRFHYTPKIDGQWETADRIGDEHSFYRAKLAGSNAASTGIVFYAWEDSFDLYLRAVTIAKDAGFRTGWDAFPIDQADVVTSGVGRSTGLDPAGH